MEVQTLVEVKFLKALVIKYCIFSKTKLIKLYKIVFIPQLLKMMEIPVGAHAIF